MILNTATLTCSSAAKCGVVDKTNCRRFSAGGEEKPAAICEVGGGKRQGECGSEARGVEGKLECGMDSEKVHQIILYEGSQPTFIGLPSTIATIIGHPSNLASASHYCPTVENNNFFYSII